MYTLPSLLSDFLDRKEGLFWSCDSDAPVSPFVIMRFFPMTVPDYVALAGGFLPDPTVFLTFPLTVLVFVLVRWPLPGSFFMCLTPLQAPISFKRRTFIITCLLNS